MVRNRCCAVRWTGFLIAIAVTLSLATDSFAIQLAIVESPDAKAGLWATGFNNHPFYNDQLTSPSGETFTNGTILKSSGARDLLRQFDTVSAALDFVAGNWLGTRTRILAPMDVDSVEFSIAPIPLAAINRTAPTLVTPLPSAKIKNGGTFEFGWDYVTGGVMPNQSIYTVIPQFDPLSGSSRLIVETPVPGKTTNSSGETGPGDRRFKRTMTNVPGTDKNRFLLSFEAAPVALPLDVEITLGSFSPLADYVTPRGQFPTIFWDHADLYYSREIDPFIVTLTVPEPSSLGLACAMACCGMSLRRRSRA